MEDFRRIQINISALTATPSSHSYQAAGYGILRQCHAEAQAVLSTHFDTGLLEAQSAQAALKPQLQRCATPSQLTDAFRLTRYSRILLDASARRFRVHRIYLRAAAAMRWVNRRTQYLQGQTPGPAHATALRQFDDTLRAVSIPELAT